MTKRAPSAWLVKNLLIDDLMKKHALDACMKCQGMGILDDCQAGDIYYNTWECDACKGTGYNCDATSTLDVPSNPGSGSSPPTP
jgi:hypothetical protein